MSLESSTVRTFGGLGRGSGQFTDPAGLAIDMSGNFIIADAGNHRLQVAMELICSKTSSSGPGPIKNTFKWACFEVENF